MPCLPGRKHQVRRHCAEGLDSPVVGDMQHGGRLLNVPVHDDASLHSALLRWAELQTIAGLCHAPGQAVLLWPPSVSVHHGVVLHRAPQGW